jgi:two-component system, LuxR family, response regulator FixJ
MNTHSQHTPQPLRDLSVAPMAHCTASAAAGGPGVAVGPGVVHIVDDDEAIREALEFLLSSVKLSTKTFASAEAFLASLTPATRGCVVTDVRMPGMGGLELQRQLRIRGSQLPVIVMTGHGDVPMAVRAMKDGATEFLEKPVHDQTLIDAIQVALREETQQYQHHQQNHELQARFATLSPREVEVFGMIVRGQSNKQVAAQLELSEKTIEIHRAGVMRKMKADSLPSLVRMAIEIEQQGLQHKAA